MILETVRGCDLFIISDVTNNSMSFKVNGRDHYMSPDDHYQDLKRIIAAASSSAHRISVIMPFLYQSRQHKRERRESLDCAMALEELSAMGVANIVTFDAHDPCVQNAIPLHDFDNYSPDYHFLNLLMDCLWEKDFKKKDILVVSPDEGAMGRAVYLANNLEVDMGMFYKRRDYSRIVNGKNPIVAHEFLGSDVEGKTVIIVDDMIASGDSMLDTCKELRRRKAKRVIVFCTFGLFTSGFENFDRYYEAGYFDYIVTTNLNYRKPELLDRPWYLEADMTKYVATIINTLNHDVSLSDIMSHTEKLQRLINRYKRGEF